MVTKTWGGRRPGAGSGGKRQGAGRPPETVKLHGGEILAVYIQDDTGGATGLEKGVVQIQHGKIIIKLETSSIIIIR